VKDICSTRLGGSALAAHFVNQCWRRTGGAACGTRATGVLRICWIQGLGVGLGVGVGVRVGVGVGVGEGVGVGVGVGVGPGLGVGIG
jgi:hypothetical protein